MELARNTRSTEQCRNLETIIETFLVKTGYPFIDDVICEIENAIKEGSPTLPHFDVFNPESTTVNDRESHIDSLSTVYGNSLIDIYEEHSTEALPIINKVESCAESVAFFEEFDEATTLLKEKVKVLAQAKLRAKELNQNELMSFIVENSPSSVEVYQHMCKEGCLHQFPNIMHLFRLSLLIPPSTANVERGCSAMNLLCSPLRTSLNESNLDRFMRINLNGPKQLSDSVYEHFVDKFKSTHGRRIEL